jgi:hypothetical protein
MTHTKTPQQISAQFWKESYENELKLKIELLEACKDALDCIHGHFKRVPNVTQATHSIVKAIQKAEGK